MTKSNDIKIIGVSGLARSGKDTFVSIAKNILSKNGFKPIRIAFADKLKEEVQSMLDEYGFGISTNSNNTEEKSIIRPLFVWWGCQRRNESPDGLYWITRAEHEINYYCNTELEEFKDKLVFFISDCRFPNEADWIHNNYNGEVIHLAKYITTFNNQTNVFEKQFDLPPNDEERKQDPLVIQKSDQCIDWEKSNSNDVLLDNKLYNIVLESLNNTRYFKHPSIGILS